MNTLPTLTCRRQTRVPILFWIVVFATVLAGRGVPGQEAEPEAEVEAEAEAEAEAEVVATVGTTRLTRVDLEQAVRRRSGGKAVPADQQQRLQAQALGELVEQALLQTEIERRHVEVSDAEIDDRIAQLSAELAVRQSSLETFLTDAGLDHDGFREQMRFEIAVPKLLLPMITEDVMKQILATHRVDFDGTRMRASHIIIRPEASAGPAAVTGMLARAERIRAAVLAEEITFADAARRYSAGPSRHRGGDLGFFPRHGLLAEEFASQVFKLTKGEVSKPFVTPLGVHVVKVTDIDPGTIDAEVFRKPLEQLAFQKVLQQFVAFCQQRTPIELKPGFVAIDPRAPGPRP